MNRDFGFVGAAFQALLLVLVLFFWWHKKS
jgi:hypothetical protein